MCLCLYEEGFLQYTLCARSLVICLMLMVYLPCSLLIQLRCQVHMELAKCEEDIEQIQVAMEHLKKVGERMRV